MGYRDSHGRDGWHTDTNSIDSMGFEMLPAHAPQHPIRTMQGAFEESMRETLQDSDTVDGDAAKMDALTRRRMLLESPDYERSVAGRWKQKDGENFHPLWKLVAQISFGMHLLHQGLAKSDDEVIKILQTHVDEIDGFLERTTEDLELAQRDINERIRYLKLPLEHGDVFDNMLMDRKFRNAILDGNEKIEHIVDRTSVALRDTLKDVKKGFDGTRELARYFRKLDSTWENQTEEHMGVYAAMMGNTEGWTTAYIDLQNKGNVLHDSLTELSTIIAEIQRRVGIASRKNILSVAPSQASSQHPSRVNSVYSATSPQSPTQKPHISSAIGTGMRRHGSTSQTQEKKAYTGDRYDNPNVAGSGAQTLPNSRGRSRRGSDDSTSRGVSFTDQNEQIPVDTAKRSSGSNWGKRQSKDRKSLEGFKTSWFRKSGSEGSSLKDKDKRKSASETSLTNATTSEEFDGILRSSSVRAAQTVTPKGAPQPSQATIVPAVAPLRVSESIGTHARRPARESVADNVLEEVTEEEEVASEEEEPEVEIAQASQVESTSKDHAPHEVTISSHPASPVTAQSPVLRDLPLRDYKPLEPVADSPPRLDVDSGPSLAEAVASLKRSSTFHGTERSSMAESSTRASDLRPEPLRVQRVSSFEPFDKKRMSEASGSQSAKSKTPAKRPANLKLFPTISVSPGPQTAPLASTQPLYSPARASTPDTGVKRASQDETKLEEELPKQPRTPAERGRSPPPPERVPTPLQEKRTVSPTLEALTSATVSGPEPDFPYGYGAGGAGGVGGEDEEAGLPPVAELGPGRRTADGSRASTPTHAELEADSFRARNTPQAVQSSFMDPQDQVEEAHARRRAREYRDEEEKKKVQERIMSSVVQKASMDLSNRDVRDPTGNTAMLHNPPQVLPPNREQSQRPRHVPMNVQMDPMAPPTPGYNLPFSKHNRSGRDIKSLLKRFFRVGQNKERKVHIGGDPGEFERPKERRGFSLSLPFGLSHRRKRSQDQRLNMQGGLQPFGVWHKTAQGMSWGDTRRGSNSNGKHDPGAETDTDESPDNTDPAESAQIPGVVPRPQKGTMDIPGVGVIDWHRASQVIKSKKQHELALQNLLQEHGGSEAPPVPHVPAEHASHAQETEDKDGEGEEDEGKEEDGVEEHGDHAGDALAHKRAAAPAEEEDEDESLEHHEGAEEQHQEHQAVGKHHDNHEEDEEADTSEDSSRHPSPRPGSVARSERSHHSEHSEQSGTTGGRTSLATSSMLARKSDATPTTGLSLQLSSPLTSEILMGGHHLDDSKHQAALANRSSADSAKDMFTLPVTHEEASSPPRSGGLTRGLSTGASGAARSPALGADRAVDPLDRAGHQLHSLQAHSPKAHERESLGISDGVNTFSKDASNSSPTSGQPPRTTSLGQTMLHDESSDDEAEETGAHHAVTSDEEAAFVAIKQRGAEEAHPSATGNDRPASSGVHSKHSAHQEEEEHAEEKKEEDENDEVEAKKGPGASPHIEGEERDEEPAPGEEETAISPTSEHEAAAEPEPEPVPLSDATAENGDAKATTPHVDELSDASPESKAAVLGVGGEREPAVRVEEVMRDREHNGTPF